MRIYLPTTSTGLQQLHDAGQLADTPLTAFAVTPALREWYVDDDIESLEYAAMLEAARASLRLIDNDPGAVRRRAVLAADVPDSAVTVHDDLDRGVVRVADPIVSSQIAAIHVDDSEAEPAVAAAASAMIAADLGEPGAQDAVDDAEGYELSWYASQELGAVLVMLPLR